jgi:hypothetical protein
MLAEDHFQHPLPSPDLRRHERVPLALFGQYTSSEGANLPCLTTDVSPAGLAMSAPAGATLGERVTLHLDRIGQLEGEIVRSFDGGFAIALAISAERQEELAGQIRAIFETSALALIEATDMSLLGEAVKFDAALTRGETQVLGETTARVTRNAEGGAELEFLCVETGA